MAQDNGGPAFPVPHAIDGNWQSEPLERYSGMSLRDWFAGQVLAGLSGEVKPELGDDRTKTLARLAYTVADAMLAERAKRGA